MPGYVLYFFQSPPSPFLPLPRLQTRLEAATQFLRSDGSGLALFALIGHRSEDLSRLACDALLVALRHSSRGFVAAPPTTSALAGSQQGTGAAAPAGAGFAGEGSNAGMSGGGGAAGAAGVTPAASGSVAAGLAIPLRALQVSPPPA